MRTRQQSYVASAAKFAPSSGISVRHLFFEIEQPDRENDTDSDAKAREMAFEVFATRAELMGCNPNVGFRLEQLKPKDRRRMIQKRKEGRVSNYKVRGAVDFINYRRALKMR